MFVSPAQRDWLTVFFCCSTKNRGNCMLSEYSGDVIKKEKKIRSLFYLFYFNKEVGQKKECAPRFAIAYESPCLAAKMMVVIMNIHIRWHHNSSLQQT